MKSYDNCESFMQERQIKNLRLSHLGPSNLATVFPNEWSSGKVLHWHVWAISTGTPLTSSVLQAPLMQPGIGIQISQAVPSLTKYKWWKIWIYINENILAELLISSLMPFLPADLTCTKVWTCAYSVSTTGITFRYWAAICIVMRHFIFPAFRAMYISFVVTGIASAVTLYEIFYNLIISCYCYKIILLIIKFPLKYSLG